MKKEKESHNMKTISSLDTDPKKSDSNFYAWIDIKDDRIVMISELIFRVHGRGETWHEERNTIKELEYHMMSIGRRWPNLYSRTREMCPVHQLPTIEYVRAQQLEFEISCIEGEIKDKKKELKSLQDKKKRMEKKLANESST